MMRKTLPALGLVLVILSDLFGFQDRTNTLFLGGYIDTIAWEMTKISLCETNSKNCPFIQNYPKGISLDSLIKSVDLGSRVYFPQANKDLLQALKKKKDALSKVGKLEYQIAYEKVTQFFSGPGVISDFFQTKNVQDRNQYKEKATEYLTNAIAALDRRFPGSQFSFQSPPSDRNQSAPRNNQIASDEGGREWHALKYQKNKSNRTK